MSTIVSRIDRHGPTFKANAAHYDGLLVELRARHAHALAGGGARLIERHHARNKMLVRERIDLLLDPLTPFLELSPLAAWGLYENEVPSAGIVTGIGVIAGTPCMIIANDATVKGGSFFAETVKKHVRAQDIAEHHRLPVHLPRRLRRRVPAGAGPRVSRQGPLRQHVLPAVPDVGSGHAADRGRVRRLHRRAAPTSRRSPTRS